MFDLGSAKRPFFGLRWKLFINLMLVLAAIHFAYGYYSYLELRERVEQERITEAERELYLLEELVESSYRSLLEVGEVIPLLVLEQSEGQPTSTAYRQAIERYYPSLLISGSVDAVYLYDDRGLKVAEEGVVISLPDQIITQVMESESPVKYFYCEDECLRFMAFPVRISLDQIGVMAVGREMQDIILNFKSQSGRDIGLALQPKGMVKVARQWKMDLKYLTQKVDNLDLLNNLVNRVSIPYGGGVFEIEHNDRLYQVLLEPPQGAMLGQAYWILIDDYTDRELAAENELFANLLFASAGLFIAALFQLAVLRSPLQRLSDITDLLPLLARSSYEEAQQRLGGLKRRHVYRDELDQLQESTFDLSQQLGRLEESLLERAQVLMERSIQLEAERDFVTCLLDTAEAIIITLDDEGKIVSVNRFGQEVLGLNRGETTGIHFLDLQHDQNMCDQHRQCFNRLFVGTERKVQIESSIRSDSEQEMQISWLYSTLDIPGSEARVLAIGLDFTERMHAEKQLVWMANHDSLTSLPNRLMFNRVLDEAISRAEEGEVMAVLFCDMDAFKDVNDSLGHPVGDELLKQAAERMQNVIQNDALLARLGGDEFTILLEKRHSVREVKNQALQILGAFRQPFDIDGYEIFSTLSVGISLYPEHGHDVLSLIQHADVAMFDAKERGKNQVMFYQDEQSSQRYERFSLVNDLRRALERDEFQVYYQPQIDSLTGKVMGVEALLRWLHPEVGMVSPLKFIPLAEEQGLIVPIGEWVLEQACAHGKAWHDSGMQFRIGVNIAGQQIMHESLLPTVKRVIMETGIDPSLLDLEVTENFLLRQPESTIPKLRKIRELGLSLSMDDFGTGYSSLSYLKKLPLNTLKIDKSFVRDIGEDPEGEAIVKAIIVMAQSLGLDVLAEGVETHEQLAYLRDHGCHLIQGFYFSRPLPADELPDFVMHQAASNYLEKG